MIFSKSDQLNRQFHIQVLQKLNWLYNTKPKLLATTLARLLAPDERRRIITTASGIRFYADPMTHIGRVMILDNEYEEKTINIFRSEIKAGQVVLDIGANEGFFSALAGIIVGPQGTVISVEPQSRLTSLIEINLRINQVENFFIFQNAFGENEQIETEISLYPSMYSGQSSLVKKYKYSPVKVSETAKFVSIETILKETKVNKIDFVKVDVEGFEHKVVEALLPFIHNGTVHKLILDYHTEILQSQNLDPMTIHQSLIEAGMVIKSSLTDPQEQGVYGTVQDLSSGKRAYLLYENKNA